MADNRIRNEEDIEEILRLAVRQGHEGTTDLRQRLQETANELGISPEALATAEKQYFSKQGVESELKEYQESRKRGAMGHLISYLVVNLGLFFISQVSDKGDNWYLFPLIGWGIGLFIHLGSVFFVKPAITDDEFRSWRRQKQRALRRMREQDEDDDD